MDVPRQNVTRRRWIKRSLIAIVLVGLVVAITLGLSKMKPAAPTVERATVWMDTVKRGEMIRDVRGLGTLVPLEIRWIPATSQGRIETRLVQPGAIVNPDTILLVLSNPELEQTAVEAEMQLKASEADFANLKVQLESQLLNQRAAAATVKADFNSANLEAESNEELAKDRLISDLILKRSKLRAEELAIRHDIEQQRLAISSDAVRAQLAAQQARVEQLRALYQLRRQQVERLKVRAGMSGVVQQVPVDVGQQVSPGTNLARVADPTRLKAEIRVAETQAKDIVVGQTASIDTRNGMIAGHVMRIDPAVQNGTVLVDVALAGELPKGARPDLSVEGKIELERLENAIYVGRPAFGQERSTIGLFKLEADGIHARRVQVKVGRTSVNMIEILEGLQSGDQVVLSDMSQWDAVDRVRLN
jgi:HlyD family secretion protein